MINGYKHVINEKSFTARDTIHENMIVKAKSNNFQPV